MLEIDIEYLKSVVVEAGDAALKRCDGIAFELKADSSYVTDIDRDTEQFIQRRLEQKYPAFAYQGEEFGRQGSESSALWAVDPIDGTTNMVFGIPLWCVSVGLIDMDEGAPVAGAIYMPATRELYWGERGKGSYRNGAKLTARERTAFHAEDTLGFTSGAIKTLDVTALPGRIRCLGSIATEVIYTARGALCCHSGCFEGINDLAAALCIAFEAGCVAQYMSGETVVIADMVREEKTRGPFVVAAPVTAALIRASVKPR